jgi:hypothetical protein
VPNEKIELANLLSLFPTKIEFLDEDFTKLENRSSTHQLCSKVVINVMENLIPRVQYPLDDISYLPAIRIAKIIEKWR